jgi:hypothetical protein
VTATNARAPDGPKEPHRGDHRSRRLSAPATLFLGLLIMAIGIVLVPLNWQTWGMVNDIYDVARQSEEPAAQGGSPAGEEPAATTSHRLLWFDVEPSIDTSLVALVMVSAVTGSYVHLATSFGTYVGNQRLRPTWAWWYLLRLSIGLALALVFYFAIRGGLLSVSGEAEQINPYGIAAIAGLVGLFSKQATDKLRETFDTIFATGRGYGDDERQDKASNPEPRIAGLEPAVATAPATEELQIVIRGEGFVRESVVRVGTRPLPTTFLSSTQLRAAIPADLLGEPGDVLLLVVNPEPGGGQSDPVTLRVEATT